MAYCCTFVTPPLLTAESCIPAKSVKPLLFLTLTHTDHQKRANFAPVRRSSDGEKSTGALLRSPTVCGKSQCVDWPAGCKELCSSKRISSRLTSMASEAALVQDYISEDWAR